MKYLVVKSANILSSKGQLLESNCTLLHEPFETREAADEFFDTVDLPVMMGEPAEVTKEIIEVNE